VLEQAERKRDVVPLALGLAAGQAGGQLLGELLRVLVLRRRKGEKKRVSKASIT
jgi:hypothetical protein